MERQADYRGVVDVQISNLQLGKLLSADADHKVLNGTGTKQHEFSSPAVSQIQRMNSEPK